MENNEHRHHNNSFGTAFFLGFLLGAGIVLLLATKTGRRLLKAFSEEGLENISDIKKHFRTAVNEFTAEDDTTDEPKAVTRIHVDEDEPEGHAKKSPSVRRFFRGTPKKS